MMEQSKYTETFYDSQTSNHGIEMMGERKEKREREEKDEREEKNFSRRKKMKRKRRESERM